MNALFVYLVKMFLFLYKQFNNGTMIMTSERDRFFFLLLYYIFFFCQKSASGIEQNKNEGLNVELMNSR
jgi:hypothetical protein